MKAAEPYKVTWGELGDLKVLERGESDKIWSKKRRIEKEIVIEAGKIVDVEEEGNFEPNFDKRFLDFDFVPAGGYRELMSL